MALLMGGAVHGAARSVSHSQSVLVSDDAVGWSLSDNECPAGKRTADSKSDKVYHLVGNLLKVPFWDRVAGAKKQGSERVHPKKIG